MALVINELNRKKNPLINREDVSEAWTSKIRGGMEL